MNAKKLSVSFDGDLVKKMKKAAKRTDRGNISAWLAEAAKQRLRQEGWQEFFEEFEAQHGPIPKELEEKAAKLLWPRED